MFRAQQSGPRRWQEQEEVSLKQGFLDEEAKPKAGSSGAKHAEQK